MIRFGTAISDFTLIFATAADNLDCTTLRNKCSHLELFWSISPYSVRVRENADHNSAEYGHFSRSVTGFSNELWSQKKSIILV